MNTDRVLKLARCAYPEDKDKELRVAYMLGLDRGYEERENEEDETVTDCHQLEKEIRTYCSSSFRFNYNELNDSFYSNTFEFDDIVELARHFAKWGKNNL